MLRIANFIDYVNENWYIFKVYHGIFDEYLLGVYR